MYTNDCAKEMNKYLSVLAIFPSQLQASSAPKTELERGDRKSHQHTSQPLVTITKTQASEGLQSRTTRFQRFQMPPSPDLNPI